MNFQRHPCFNQNLLLFLVLLIVSCSDKSTSSGDGNDGTDSIEKSPKRGLAYNLTNSEDLEALKNGVSWWYNWDLKTTATDGYHDKYQLEFIPMLWGGNTSDLDIQYVKAFILVHPEIKYLLVMNEPNLTDQANRYPQHAASDWLKYEQVVSDLAAQQRTIELVGPAMNWGTLPHYEDPVSWLDDFYSSYKSANKGRDPKIDYLAFHWYDYGLEAQLDRLQKYGKKIWITEMANWNPQVNSYIKQAEQMQEMVALCESRDDVFRYAWFIGRGDTPDNHFTYLFNATPGELNTLGNLYINLPYKK